MKKRTLYRKEERYKQSFKNQLLTLIFKIKSLSIIKYIFFFYLFITLIGSLLLFLPISKENNSISYVNALFVAASAFSDTGLTPITIGTNFSYFGQAIILVLIFIGGTGVIALKIYFFNILFNIPMSLKSRVALAQERGSTKIGMTNKLIKVSVTAMIILSIIGAIILLFYFYYIPGNFNAPNEQSFNPYHNWNTSIRYGLFHSISALNNAGFDIMGPHSISPYYSDYGIQFIFIVLFVIGGIGFPVIYDVYEWSRIKAVNPYTNTEFKFSLFTKVSTITYLIITVIGLTATFLVEINSDPLQGNGVSIWNGPGFGTRSDRIMALFFNTMSTRNAGFATVNYQSFNGITLVIHSVLMFLGSAPSSTGGGIRTTTIAIVFLTIWKHITNKSTVRTFKRQIHNDTVVKSLIVLATAIMLVIVTSVILVTSLQSNGGEIPMNQYSINDIVFEVCSAFGTTGLSTGLTHYLNTISKLALILVMFIGQLGVSSTLLVWGNKKTKSRHYHFYTEKITTG